MFITLHLSNIVDDDEKETKGDNYDEKEYMLAHPYVIGNHMSTFEEDPPRHLGEVEFANSEVQ